MKPFKSTLLLFCVFPLTSCSLTSLFGKKGEEIDQLAVKIKASEQITVDGVGDVYFVNVKNATETYNFGENVETNKDSTWTVTFDAEGKEEIPNKTVELTQGDNALFYITVTSKNNETKTYVVKIHRNVISTITFSAEAGKIASPFTDDYGHNIRKNNDGNLYTVAEEHDLIFPLPRMTYPGYKNIGYHWEENGETKYASIDKPYEVGNSNLLTASYDKVIYNIKLDADGGYVFNKVHSGDYFRERSFPRADKPGYIFEGWYEGENLVPKDKPLSSFSAFDSSKVDHTFKAKYKKGTSTEQLDYDRYSLFLGEYPQSLVKDENLKAELSKIELVNEKGYIEYNDEQYKKLEILSNAIDKDLNFAFYDDDGKEVGFGNHYFKVEPVKWVRGRNGMYLMDQILDKITHPEIEEISTSYHDLETNLSIKDGYDLMENLIFSEEEKDNLLSTKIISKDYGQYSLKKYQTMKLLPIDPSYLPEHNFKDYTIYNPFVTSHSEPKREEHYSYDKNWLSRTTEYARANGVDYIYNIFSMRQYPISYVRGDIPFQYTCPYYLIENGVLSYVDFFGKSCAYNDETTLYYYLGSFNDLYVGFRCAIKINFVS